MRFPTAGSVMERADVIPMNIRGQGIAWDRASPGTLAGIRRATRTAKQSAARPMVAEGDGGDHARCAYDGYDATPGGDNRWLWRTTP